MQHRTLGNQGLEVSAVGYGAMGLTIAYGPTDEQAGVAAIQRAHDLGVTFFDTAEAYGMGTGSNEILLGKAVKDFRDELVLATKFGIDLASNPYGGGLNSRPDNIRKVADNSLRYLGTDRIDVFYQHRVDPEVPIEDVAGAVKELIDAGKVKYFGLSEAGPQTIRRAHAVQPVSVLQTEYSLFAREVEELFPVLDELGIGFVAYSPLGRGFITGSAKPASQYDPTDHRNRDPATSRRTSRPWAGSVSSPRRRASPSRSWPWPGCSPRASTSCPSPAPAALPASRRTPQQPTSFSPRPTSPGSGRSCPTVASAPAMPTSSCPPGSDPPRRPGARTPIDDMIHIASTDNLTRRITDEATRRGTY